MPETHDDYKKLATIDYPGLEIFATGTFNGDTYELKDLEAMVSAFPEAGFKPTVKAGHPDGQEDEKIARKIFGAPALGYINRIYLEGKKLMADLVQVPKRFADLIKAGAYRRVSAEIYWNYTDDASGRKFPKVLKAVSILGADIPALTNLKEIEALYKRTEAGALFAYDGEHEFRRYDLEKEYFDTIMGEPLSSYLTRFPRKTKQVSAYKLVPDSSVSDPEAKICSNCRFFLAFENACVIVEGFIEPNFTSKFFEPRQMVFSGYVQNNGTGATVIFDDETTEENYAEDQHNYIVRKIGDEYCLIAKGSGKKLGCHPTKEKAIDQERAIKANTAKDDTDNLKGGLTMADKTAEEKAKELQDAADKKNADALKLLQKEHQEKLDTLQKDYDTKLADAEKDKEKQEKAALKSEEENTELVARMAVLEQKDRENEVNSWIKDRKVAGKMLPVEENRVRAIALYLAEKKITHTYADGDKEVKESLLSTFKALFSDETRKSGGLFKQLTTKDGPEKREIEEDAGSEATKRAVEYMHNAKKDGHEVSLMDAYTAIFAADPELKAKYAAMSKQ